MMEQKTDMNITEIDKYKKTEQHFYDGPQNNYTFVNQTINIYKSNKGVTNLKTPQEKG